MATQKTIALHTLGCKLNYSETSSLGRLLEEAGFILGSYQEYADVYVINTCSVTEFADRKCRQFIRRVLRQNPQAQVVVMGCYAQLKPEEIAAIPGVDLVLGAKDKFFLVDYLTEFSKVTDKALIRHSAIEDVSTFEGAFSFGNRTRSFLKIQDGCDYKCSFCTIPQARGKSRSNNLEAIIGQANEIAALGAKEIVLTGVNVGDYQHDGNTLLDLMIALEQVKDIKRIRISSIEPNLCSEEIIRYVCNSERFMPHFHMPLQSGSDAMLKSMRRRYKRELYQDRVQMIKTLSPAACIGADVIVGFPGETDELFEESYQFIEGLDIDYLHVFTYSERANTLAPELEGLVPMGLRKSRNARLRKLGDAKNIDFQRRHLGNVRDVLIENNIEDGHLTGLTDNYIRIRTPQGNLVPNEVYQLRLKSRTQSGLVSAAPCNKENPAPAGVL